MEVPYVNKTEKMDVRAQRCGGGSGISKDAITGVGNAVD
jgi:hypothetical protein